MKTGVLIALTNEGKWELIDAGHHTYDIRKKAKQMKAEEGGGKYERWLYYENVEMSYKAKDEAAMAKRKKDAEKEAQKKEDIIAKDAKKRAKDEVKAADVTKQENKQVSDKQKSLIRKQKK